MNQTKICSHCKQEKSINEFHKRKNRKCGVISQCKNCTKENTLLHQSELKTYRKQYYILNKKEVDIKNKIWTLKHPGKTKIYAKKWRLNNPEKQRNSTKKWRENNPEKVKIMTAKGCKKYYKKHKPEINLKYKIYYNKNKPKVRNTQRKYQNNKRKTNSLFRIIDNYRRCINQALKSQNVKKPCHTIELLNCTKLQHQERLKSLFQLGMILENNLKRKWVQHHLISTQSVNLNDIEQLKKVCHYTNIVPMWEDEHKEFHRRYGTKTTKAQYDEFMKEKI